MTKEELRKVCAEIGGGSVKEGKQILAGFIPVTVRAVEQWLAGSRGIRPPEEARIRECHRQHREGA